MFPLCLLHVNQDGIAQFCQNIHGFGLYRQPSALHPREVQQLFHHSGKSFCFVDNHVHPLLHRFRINVQTERFCPALNRRQWCPQFMGNRGNKLVFHRLGFREGRCHIIDRLAQIPDFILRNRRDSLGEIPLCKFFRNRIDAVDGSNNRPQEKRTCNGQQQQNPDANDGNHRCIISQSRINLRHGRNHPNRIVFRLHGGDIHTHRHDTFPVLPANPCSCFRFHCRFIVRHRRPCIGSKARGCQRHSALGIDCHQFHAFLVGKVFKRTSQVRRKIRAGIL